MPKFLSAHPYQALAPLALASLSLWGAPAHAAERLADVQAVVPAESGDWRVQLARAENMRKLAKQERSKAEAERAKRDAACQSAFFVNPCLNASRDKWLERIGPVRGADIEANRLEREARAAELAENERVRLANPPLPGGMVVQTEGSRPTHQLRATPVEPKPVPASPQPTAKPIDRAAAARAEQESRQQREAAAAAAAERASKARSDAAVYAERARLAAERRTKKSGQSAPAPGSSSAPAATSK